MPIKPPASIAVSKKGLTLPLSICPITPTSVENHTTIRLVPACIRSFLANYIYQGRQAIGITVLLSFSHAIEVTQNNDFAYYNLGVAYGSLGRYQDAIEAYKQAIRIKPDDAEAHNNLGITYLTTGDKGSALEEYKILKTLNAELANKLFNFINK